MSVTVNDVEWSWAIRRVSVKKSSDNLLNVITSATWLLEAEYIDVESKEQYVKGYADVTELSAPDENNFIGYDQITNDVVVSWIEEVEKERLDAIKEKIILKINQECGNEIDAVLKDAE